MVVLLVALVGLAAGPVDATYESTPTKTLPGSPAVFDPPGVMWIFKLPAGMGNYLIAPAGDWSCRDNNAGTSVGASGFLAGPKPSASCKPPVPGGCHSVTAGAITAGQVAGQLSVRSNCTGLSTSYTAPANSGGIGLPSGGAGAFAFTCTADDTLLFSATSVAFYIAICGVNMGPNPDQQPSGPNPPSLPDLTCEPAVGLGDWLDKNHVYSSPEEGVTTALDPCIDHYSGELGYAMGGAWLFSRTGSTSDPDGTPGQGSGVDGCYASPASSAGTPSMHHGSYTRIHVKDDQLGGGVGFLVTRDWSRLGNNNGPGNADNGRACGDGLIEACAPPFLVEPACNHLDEAIAVPAGSGASNTWTVPAGGSLADIAGADGAVVVFLSAPATTGQVWTS